MTLQEFKDNLSKLTTGMTTRDGHTKGVCIQCRNPPEFYSEMGRKEYGISGLCEFCFDLCDPQRCKNCTAPKSWHDHKKTPCTNWEPIDIEDIPED